MPEIKTIGLLLAKAEVTYGTDPVPTTSLNAIPTVGGTLTYTVNSTRVNRSAEDRLNGNLPGFNVLPNIELKFDYEMRGNLTDGVTPDISAGKIANAIEVDCFLLAANLAATYTAESEDGARDGYVVYKPTILATDLPSVTCYWYTQTKLHKLIGGKVDFSIIMEAGKMPLLRFTVKGKYVYPADTSFPSSATFLATKPQVFFGDNSTNTITFGGYTGLIFTKSTINLGNTITQRNQVGASFGIKGFTITDTVPTGNIDPETVTEATHPVWADWQAGTVKNFIVGVDGDMAGNRWQFTGQLQQTKVTYADNSGVRITNIDFDIVRTSVGIGLSGAFQLKFS